MRFLHALRAVCAAGIVAILVSGCDRAKPPEPVAIGEVPRVLQGVFTGVTGDTRALVDAVVTAVNKRDWTGASVTVQTLANRAGLTSRQAHEVARCLLAINTRLSEAATAGDSEAEQLRQFRRANK